MSTKGKEAAGKYAAQLIESGMRVGLGTGSTAGYFISELARRCREEGLQILAVATSVATQRQAEKEGIPLLDINTVPFLDIDVDGADEIDSEKRMIKGGGGALFREKIVAAMSQEMIVVTDASKQVEFLGRFPLPVEISPFGHLSTLQKLMQKGYPLSLRETKDGKNFVTDNGNLIVDIRLPYPSRFPEKEEEWLKAIPGVIETGFFFKLAGRVIVGSPDGKVNIV